MFIGELVIVQGVGVSSISFVREGRFGKGREMQGLNLLVPAPSLIRNSLLTVAIFFLLILLSWNSQSFPPLLYIVSPFFFSFRTMESLYEELVHEGILVRAPKIRLRDYSGEYRYSFNLIYFNTVKTSGLKKKST